MIVKKAVSNESFSNFLKLIPPLDIQQGPVVAGGAARRLWFDQDWAKGDIDVFFVNQQQRTEWATAFEHKRGVNKSELSTSLFTFGTKASTYKSMSTDNADTYVLECRDFNLKLQVIKTRYADNFVELFKDFDFAASCFATDGRTAVAMQTALTSVAQKKLIMNNTTNDKNLALRVLKYHVYGFEAEDSLLRTVADKIATGDFTWESNY